MGNIVRHVKNREHTHGASCPGKRQEREGGEGGSHVSQLIM